MERKEGRGPGALLFTSLDCNVLTLPLRKRVVRGIEKSKKNNNNNNNNNNNESRGEYKQNTERVMYEKTVSAVIHNARIWSIEQNNNNNNHHHHHHHHNRRREKEEIEFGLYDNSHGKKEIVTGRTKEVQTPRFLIFFFLFSSKWWPSALICFARALFRCFNISSSG
eukprot:gene8843-6224_t